MFTHTRNELADYFLQKKTFGISLCVCVCVCVCMTFVCQGLLKYWVERRLQLLLDILQQNWIPKLDSVLQYLQVVWHLKVYYFETLHM